MGELTAELIEIFDAWDRVSGAIDRVLTSQPFQMTESAALLGQRRQEMRDVLASYAMHLARSAALLEPSDGQ